MGLILDTSVLIAHERRKFDIRPLLLAHANEPVAIAAITLSELLHGWHRATDLKIKADRDAYISSVRRDFVIIPFGPEQAEEHSRLWAELAVRGEMIGAHDLQIAATALSLGYSLATRNKHEFVRVPGLQVV